MLRAAAIALLVVISSCSSEHKAAPQKSSFEAFVTTSPKPGEAAPAFELTDTNGAPVTLSEAVARGPVVLVFGSFT